MHHGIILRARLLVVCGSLLVPVLSRAQTAPPIGDTYSSSRSTSTNYGAQTLLEVTTTNDSYLQFSLAALPPGGTIAKATLRLYVNSVTTAGSFDVYQVTSSWAENTLTYKAAPGLGGSATGGHPVSITSSNSGDFVLIDITPLAQDWWSGAEPNDGVELVLTTSAGSFTFDSKESTTTSHEPALEVAMTGPEGPAGPQGSQGLTGPMGPAGLPGPVGPQGPQGLPGAQGPGVGFNYRGAFDPMQSYAINDAVTSLGSTYVAIAASSGPNNPAPGANLTAWSLIAAAGAAGPTGATGPSGPTGPAGTTGPAGPSGPAGPIGPLGPQGSQGAQGPAGPQGPEGAGVIWMGTFNPSATYAANNAVAYKGSTYIATQASQGPSNPTPDVNTAAWSLMAAAATANFAGAGAAGDLPTFTGTSAGLTDSGTQLSNLAPKASPTFTGSVTIPFLTAGLVTAAAGGALGSESYLSASQFPGLGGDLAGSSGSLAVTVSKINGVPLPAISGATGVLYDKAGTLSVASLSGAMMAANTVTAAQLAAQYSRGACTEVWGGTGAANALQSGDDAISDNTCYNDSGVTRTITAVKCRSDSAANTTTVNPTLGSAGAGASILSAALTCGSSYAYGASGTVANAAWASGTGINPAMGGALTGTSIAVIVEYTY